ncbi:MAG TPA: ankyrin repeat domain-containing protein [Pyrinomonadaceae bacterium]|nr:ankyrin repeat domain-containing protein [Pyrinomonadaceae bacterium]
MREKIWSAALTVVLCCFVVTLVCEKPACAQRKGEDMSTMREFFKAVTDGDAAKVRELLKKNPSLAKAKGQDGVSALLQAVYHGRDSVVSLLLASGIELDIFEAAATGRAERVRALLKSKPYLANAFATDGFTPLGLAAFFGHEEAVKVLLDGGAEVNVSSRNALKAVPLRSAAVAGHLDIARLLIARGADVNARGEGGQTPLHEVAGGGRIEFAKLLLDHGADINARGDDGKTPLTVALESRQTEMANFLRSRGGAQ